MPGFSRSMPPAPARRATPAGWAVLALIAVGVAVALWLSPFARGAVALVAVGVAVGAVADRRGRSSMRVLRSGEDIGTFVRTLDRRDPAFDPRVVRAVWDALRAELRAGSTDMPLRPGDRIAADLGIDWEEVEFDVLPAVAARTGRSLAIREARRNPMYRRVRTVADLIRFIALQPPSAAA